MEKESTIISNINMKKENVEEEKKIDIKQLDKGFQDAKKKFEGNSTEENLNQMRKAFDEIIAHYQKNMEETENKA